MGLSQGALAFCATPIYPSFGAGVLGRGLLPRRQRLWSAARKTRRLQSVRAVANDGVVVCPGKFDTFHRGHRALASAAAAFGSPTLLSFSGMAETLGWAPRAPVVAPVERPAILRAWAATVGRPVGYRILPFGDIRELAPRDFVNMLVKELGAVAVVCGADWRFGHRAAGDVALLRELAAEMPSFHVCVVDAVRIPHEASDNSSDGGVQEGSGGMGEDGIIVSSSAVRRALAKGDVALAARMMDRPHRLVGWLDEVAKDHVISGEFVNQVPGDGLYQVLVRVPGQSDPVRSFARVKRPSAVDPMLPSEPGSVQVSVADASSVYCDGCEVYIDFEERVS